MDIENEKMTAREAAYLVDRDALLHLKEAEGGDFEYAVFDKRTKEKIAGGRITEDAVMDGIDPTHDRLAAARDAAVKEAGLYGIEASQVGVTSLAQFPKSDIYRRSIWEPESLPKNDIRFIDSSYNELFRVPDGGTIQLEYPDRVVSARCEYIDDYHTRISGELYHICQFAEKLERNGGVCRPEPVLEADRAAWQIGGRGYLTVECGAGHWNYHLLDDKMARLKSGELELLGFSINEVRDMILTENRMERRTMTPTDYGLLIEKVAALAEMDIRETASVSKPSIRSQLAAAKTPRAEKPSTQQRRENQERGDRRNDLPETCFSTLPSEGKLILLKRDEKGFYPSDWETGSAIENSRIAAWHNRKCGINPAQVMAMQIGSMFGFDVPGADPQHYFDEAKPAGAYPLEGGADLYDGESLHENVTGRVFQYEIAGETCFYLEPASIPESMMGIQRGGILWPDMVQGKPMVPVFLKLLENNVCEMTLERGCFIPGKEMNANYQITAKVSVGPVEYAMGELDGKFPSFVTWERTPANDGGGPPNYYWGHYFESREMAVQDLCTRAREKYEMLTEDRKPSIRGQLAAAKAAQAEMPAANQRQKDKGAR